MSLRGKLILSIFVASFGLSLVTVLFFVFVAYKNMKENVEEVYGNVARTFSFAQRTLAEGADDVVFKLENCKKTRALPYVVLREEGLYVGRVVDCTFYGTKFLRVVNFTANINSLNWFILYEREVIERLSENKPEFFDRFINGRVVIDNLIVEGEFDPKILPFAQDSVGYNLTNLLRTLIIDLPLIVEDGIPVGKVVFIEDFTPMLREALFIPLVFLSYTLVLVTTLSAILFTLFSKIVKEISVLREMTTKFKDLDFSEVPRLNEMVGKPGRGDELYQLKRAILIMAQELEETINELQQEKKKFEELAYTDPLTKLSNRRFFIKEANRILELAKRYGEPLSLLMLDIDNFKRINDEYGHDVGDEVIKALAWIIKENVRSSDIPARIGGEEFAILLPKTDERGAVMVAERIRHGFRNSSVKVDGKDIWTTLSIGVALYEEGDDMNSLLKKADEALYKAKRKGKDRVEVFKGKEELPVKGQP